MEKMWKIYKMRILERRVTLVFMLAASLAITFATALLTFGAQQYWAYTTVIAMAAGILFGRFLRPYELNVTVARVMSLISMNVIILMVLMAVA